MIIVIILCLIIVLLFSISPNSTWRRPLLTSKSGATWPSTVTSAFMPSCRECIQQFSKILQFFRENHQGWSVVPACALSNMRLRIHCSRLFCTVCDSACLLDLRLKCKGHLVQGSLRLYQMVFIVWLLCHGEKNILPANHPRIKIGCRILSYWIKISCRKVS